MTSCRVSPGTRLFDSWSSRKHGLYCDQVDRARIRPETEVPSRRPIHVALLPDLISPYVVPARRGLDEGRGNFSQLAHVGMVHLQTAETCVRSRPLGRGHCLKTLHPQLRIPCVHTHVRLRKISK